MGENKEVLPCLKIIIRDPQLWVVLILAVLVGILFSWVLPDGYAVPLMAEPRIWISFLLLHPLVEEWIFRGVIQGELMRHPPRSGNTLWMGISHANWVTTFFFCLAHFAAQPGLWAIAVAAPSLVFGHFRERFGRLSVPIALHILFNGVYLLSGIP